MLRVMLISLEEHIDDGKAALVMTVAERCVQVEFLWQSIEMESRKVKVKLPDSGARCPKLSAASAANYFFTITTTIYNNNN